MSSMESHVYSVRLVWYRRISHLLMRAVVRLHVILHGGQQDDLLAVHRMCCAVFFSITYPDLNCYAIPFSLVGIHLRRRHYQPVVGREFVIV